MGCIRCVAARQQKEQHVRELREKMRLGPVNYISHNKFITARSAAMTKPKPNPVVKKDAVKKPEPKSKPVAKKEVNNKKAKPAAKPAAKPVKPTKKIFKYIDKN